MSRSKKYISIKTNSGIKQVASITFYSDGGFFLQDVIRTGRVNRDCSVAKVVIDNQNHGVRKVKPHYTAFTSGDVKLSHHIDGKFQVSGEGVLSGFESDGTPKGASIKSFKLDATNDGGPFFVLNCWGVDRYRVGENSDILLTPTFNQVNLYNEKINYNAIAIKGFYILKKNLTTLQMAKQQLVIESPIEGRLNLTILQTPSLTPGIIGLYATPSTHGFESEIGFTLCGAPGFIRNGRFSDSIVVSYPEALSKNGAINLNFIKNEL